MNSNKFLEVLTKLEKKGIPDDSILILDNLSVHKTQNVKEKLEQIFHKVLYLPEYSPFLNGIEFCWSWSKQYLRKKNIDGE